MIASGSLMSCSVPDCSAEGPRPSDRPSVSHPSAETNNKSSMVGETRRKVQWVVDGDTFKICPKTMDGCKREEQISVRVKGLECPESSQEACSHKPEADCSTHIPQGQKAKADAMRTLRGQMVTLVPSAGGGHFEEDRYHRVLAYVNMPNRSDFGLSMIQKGLCYDFGFRYPHEREDAYRAAQQKAGVFPLKPKKR